MSKLEQLKDLIENRGYRIVSGDWDGSGIKLTLIGLHDEKGLYVSSTDEDYRNRKIFNYIAEKMGASNIGS